ncbi:MAG: tRNA (adenosine(37)-N6)-threonylcarbamoyltransferase complex ATPase subunit type 1 TsaE [Candidatus Peribacteria bacterium]|jgi:tRNA threonylcarbamoyladenosine biosynthesis protein TsaE|nr:tRNA (adenosine(37)-N6)-threonylcarbamoyltransferase complex ATPase subunit type 1 TsaE [Candidatus Peribacteria bacterium]
MHISSPEAMHQFGKELAHQHQILLLSGNLGAGKTTLAKGFAEGLGINPAQVQSPTYTYLNIYDDKLLHLDMYRLESFEQMVEKGILDQIYTYDYLLIERPKRINKLEL